MSSHHIVREKQEPALLILSLGGFADELLGQLLEWSPTVIATPIAAEQLNAFGIKIDVIITNDADEEMQGDITLLSPGDAMPLVAALKHLVANEYSAINIIADHFNAEDVIPFADKINTVIFTNGKKVYPIRSGFTKWKPAGDFFHILTPYSNLQVSGLTDKGGATFVTNMDGFVTFAFSEPLLFITEDI